MRHEMIEYYQCIIVLTTYAEFQEKITYLHRIDPYPNQFDLSMERISIFDIYKIGVGPSSSHTLGPWKAALDFVSKLKTLQFDKVEVHLFGSLSKTGVGHGTDLAVQLGLEGFNPKTIPTEEIGFYIQKIESLKQISINDNFIDFDPKEHIVFHSIALPEHPNTLIFKAYDNESIVKETTYYSLGGGFIEEKGVTGLYRGSPFSDI